MTLYRCDHAPVRPPRWERGGQAGDRICHPFPEPPSASDTCVSEICVPRAEEFRTGHNNRRAIHPNSLRITGGNTFGPLVYLGLVGPLDHHSRQRFGSGESDQNAAVTVERRFARPNFTGEGGQLLQWFALLYSNIEQQLRKYGEIRREFISVEVSRTQVSRTLSAVSMPSPVVANSSKDDVARLFAA